MEQRSFFCAHSHMYPAGSAAAMAEGCFSCAHFSSNPGARTAVLDTILEMVSIFVLPVISIFSAGTAALLILSRTTA